MTELLPGSVRHYLDLIPRIRPLRLIHSIVHLSLLLLVPASSYAVPGEYEIAPGKRIGAVALGDTRTAVLKRLGKSNETRRWKDGTREDHWFALPGHKRTDNYPPDLTVLSRGGKVVQVAVSWSRFALGDGTSTATTLGTIRKRYPRLKVSEYTFEDYFGLYFDDVKRGLTFFVGGQDDIMAAYKPEQIIIHRAGSPVIPNERGKRTKVQGDKTKG
jgi:hypothetical protein